MLVKLLAEHQLEFLSLKGGSTGSSESTLIKKVLFQAQHFVEPDPASNCSCAPEMVADSWLSPLI